VDRTAYGFIAKHGRSAAIGSSEHTIFGLANVFSPPGFGQVQDFTHEREWRLFSDLDLADTPPVFVICPSSYTSEVAQLFGETTSVLAIDTMHEWGA
jgi:hypothetical protein